MTMARPDRTNAEALRQARLCAQRGEWLSAEGICRYLLEANPADAAALLLLAELCFAQGRPAEALDAYDRILRDKPLDAGALYNRGVVLSALGRYQDALASFDRALARHPRDVAAMINRGNVLQSLARFADALEAFDAVLRIAPGNADARYNRGNALLAMGRNEDALAAFDAALAVRPNQVEGLLNRGSALAALGRHAEALEAYRAVLALDPRRAEAHYNAGNALRALERDADAVASYDAALALQPEHADAHWNRAWALLALGDYERGWLEHEWRSKSARWLAPPPAILGAALARRSGLRGPHAAGALGAGHRRHSAVPALCAVARAVGAACRLEIAALARAPVRHFASTPRSLRRRAAAAHDLLLPDRVASACVPDHRETIPAQFRISKRIRRWSRNGARRSRRRRALRAGLVWAGNPKQGSEHARGIGLAVPAAVRGAARALA
jgi:tetratricopeptide (TPR) repeat protein